MPTVILNPVVIADMDSIVDYIARDNPSAAARWAQRMTRLFNTLSTQPLMGQRFRQQRDVRRISDGRYVVYYRPNPNGITVLRVFHGARDHESSME